MTFDRGDLTPHHSINRVRIPARGYEPASALLSRAALIRNLRGRMPFPGTDEALLHKLEHDWLPNAHPAAVAAIADRGDALGDLLLTLKRGPPAARPEWSDDHWRFWRQLEHVRFGGGLAAGRIGQATVARAQERIGDAYRLRVADYPTQLPLLGAARHLRIDDGSAMVYDCGNTAVKRARAFYRNRRLVELQVLPQLPAGRLPGRGASRSDAGALADRIARLVAGTWRLHDQPAVAIALASYVANGTPTSDGAYGALRLLAADVAADLAARVRRRVGPAIDLRLLHDGTAAAAYLAPAPRTAAILMGTSLAVGVPPAEDRLCPVATGFRLAGA
jgi:hypothetical protein